MNMMDSFKTNDMINTAEPENIAFLVQHVLFSFIVQLNTFGYGKENDRGLC